MFQTEIEFTLPLGYLDTDGTLHRDGVMRRATAADEILLQALYNEVNRLDQDRPPLTCPKCAHAFQMEPAPLGG